MGIAARLALLLAGVLWLAGCGANADRAETTRDWPPASPAIWQVRSDAGRTAWLFGTVHALPRGLEWRTAAMDQALDQADLLVVEIAELAQDERGRATFEAMTRTPGQPPLSARLPASDRPALLALLDRTGMGDDDFATIKTWGAALMLASALREHDPSRGADRALIARAQAARLELAGLETYSSQFARFDGLSAAAQGALLVSLVEEAESPDQDARIEAWLTGDVDRLQALSVGSLLSDPELHETLLVARNRDWAEQIGALMAEGRRPFVAVGAAHLLGDEGLPALLARNGHEVTRLQ